MRVHALIAVAAVWLVACNAPFLRSAGQPPPGMGGLSGFVRTVDGQPVAGAFVAASCTDPRRSAIPEVRTAEDGWYDLGTLGLQPGPCSVKGGTDTGLSFFVEQVQILPGQTVRVDFVARP